MKRLFCWLLGLVLLSGCGQGLPQGREMDDMALMRTMGVDRGADGGVVVTVSSARRARGLQGEGEKPLILSSGRASISAACGDIQGQSDSYVFLGHVDQLLLGEALARQAGVMESMEYFLQEESLGLGTQIWLIRDGSAQQAIRGESEESVDDRLTTLGQTGRLGITVESRTVGECLSDLLERGCTCVPALCQEKRGEETVLLEAGYGILKEGVLIGWLTEEQSEGLDLARGTPGGGVLELENGTARIQRATLTCVPVMEDGVLAGLELELRLGVRMEEWNYEVDGGRLEEEVVRLGKERISGVVKQLQVWNADCVGLKELAGSARPEVWEEIRSQWNEKFPTLGVTVRCTAAVAGLEK